MLVIDDKSQARVQIEMAAKGCISGTLSEWPLLKSVLKELGYDLPDHTASITLSRLCRKLLSDYGN